MSYAISAEGLVKRFGSTTALAGIDLAVAPGTILGLLGPNGAGKTTAVRILATLVKPDAGTARVGPYDVVRDALQVRRIIGLTGQYAAVDEEMTGFNNLVLIGRLLEMPRPAAKARATELLEQFGLGDAAKRLAKTYSGGMRRRLDLAACLVGHPQVLYLDEPTTGLDPNGREEVWALVRDMTADGVTVLLTTQYLDEADRLANEIAVIDHGRVIAAGTPDELKVRVGGQRLTVEPLDAADADRTAAILGALAGASPTRDNNGRVSVPINDPALGAEALRRLDSAGIAVGELGLSRPSLDEVFFALTGHPAADPSEQDPEGGPDDLAPTDTVRIQS